MTDAVAPGVWSRTTGRLGRRPVLWISLAVAIVAAVLFSVLALSGPAGQANAWTPLMGKPAPAISGTLLGGGDRVQLSQFADKWVLVNFAASWCVPCQEEMPQLLTFASDEASTHQAVILTVAYDESDLSDLRGFLASRHATWPAVDAPSARVAYGLHGIPESFLVDPTGTVVEHIEGGLVASQLEQFIAQYPATSTSSSSS